MWPALDKIHPEFLKVVKHKLAEIHAVVYNLLFRITLAPKDRNMENKVSVSKHSLERPWRTMAL